MYEQQDGTQPAEIFEDALPRKLAGKLAHIAVALQQNGNRLGGGLIEPCHNYSGLWEMRTILSRTLARELFGFDGSRVVLLHGYSKRVGEEASQKDLQAAFAYWQDYSIAHRISPVQEDADESF